MKQITEACKSLSCEMGGVNVQNLWQLKKRLRGINCEPPTAMLDQYGNLLTSSEALEGPTIEMFKQRLQTLKIKDELKMHQVQRENMCTNRLNRAQENKTPDWTMSDLQKYKNSLKITNPAIPWDLLMSCLSQPMLV